MSKLKILVLGISGMLGNALFRKLSSFDEYKVYGTLRSSNALHYFQESLRENIILDADVENFDGLIKLVSTIQPDVTVNCIGLVKQLTDSADPLRAIPLNSILPHRLAKILSLIGGRLIHISTDCVFSGKNGMYKETDLPDTRDIYGLTKLLGEVDYENAVTLRTSIIGHELQGNRSLVNWFLSQKTNVKGYSQAIFSGLPTVELANVIHKYVIPNQSLRGLYHISSEPIDKFSLLRIIAEVYKKSVKIEEDMSVVIDRSLDSTKFQNITGFKPPPWSELVNIMHKFS